MARLGYSRVSRPSQDLRLQLDALARADCDEVFSEKESGAKEDRPELARLLATAKAGDTIVVWRLDRLARSTKQLLELSESFQREGINLVSLTEMIDTSTATGKLWFTMTAAMAQFERDLTRERTMAGLEAARERGHVGGRPAKAEAVATARKLIAAGEGVKEACRHAGISTSTYYRHGGPNPDESAPSTTERVAEARKLHAQGITVVEACRQAGISHSAYYKQTPSKGKRDDGKGKTT